MASDICSGWCLNYFSQSNILYYHITPYDIFAQALADGLSLESQWQQVSLRLQDSFQYSGQSWQRCSLDNLCLFLNFQLFQFLKHAFGDSSKRANYYWYHRHIHVPLCLMFSSKVLVSVFLFVFFDFYTVVRRNGKVHYSANSLLLLLIITRSDVLSQGKGSHLYLKIPEHFVWLILLNGFWFVHFSIGSMVKFQLFAQFPVDHLAHPLYLVAYSFSLFCSIHWLCDQYLLPHNLHLLFCCV